MGKEYWGKKTWGASGITEMNVLVLVYRLVGREIKKGHTKRGPNEMMCWGTKKAAFNCSIAGLRMRHITC